MSQAILTQVELKTQTRGFTYQLITYLARLHHDDYGYAWPGIDHLARHFRVSERTIQRHLKKIEGLNELYVARVHGRGLNNRYYLLVAGIKPPKKGDKLTRKGDKLSHRTGGQVIDFSTRSVEKVTSCQPYIDVSKTIQTTEPPSARAWKPEMRQPSWCEACGFAHSARVPDAAPGCWLEEPTP